MFYVKQDAIRRLVHQIYPDVEVVFDMSKRAKRSLARCYGSFSGKGRFIFYRPLFKYTLDSCLHCAFHEIAHLMQIEMVGETKHNAEFLNIKNMLIADYGSESIMQAKTNKQNGYSCYILDKEQK